MAIDRLLKYFIVAASFFIVVQVQARTLEEIKFEIQQRQESVTKLQEEAQKYRKELDEAQQEGRTLQREVNIFNTKIKALEREISATEEEVERANLEIEALTLEIGDLRTLVGEHQESLSEVLRTMYEDGEMNDVEILLSRSTLADLYNYIEYQNSLREALVQKLQQIKFLRKQDEKEKSDQENALQELKQLKGQLALQKDERETERRMKEELLRQTKNQEKKFQELLAQNEALRKKAQDEIADLEDALQLMVDPSRLPSPRPGILDWPVIGRLAQGYGKTAFARRTGFYRFHNGIDISTSFGTQVKTAKAGEIIGVGDTDKYCRKAAYGKWILIRHENNLTTLYAHLSKIAVEVGQKVNDGDIIGYVGNTGLTTGPHLHLTVYDSNTVNIKQSAVCGPLPIGGHLDPREYL